ncbi:DUF4236 domain-containing protein [Evansella cellulosilytica]|uniref:DUF4236 domain-containing protein n=1 Tax=Evansella cellulosilytica (strain ATCC 21833 / DSM 2522 / FERM P-1141 / JCM 9156 / N-4) TaxID=649639 RepID=E6TXU3_EVAC2|nr:DUF4236 domain-containing protein [Evansella cellulosilytica]ADU30019.1 hypothetical protein Bcell_1756 [Evansella cellulosilytica DSM 2522]
MSFRFQKRVRVAPGVRLNFSKRGVSTSVGPRGSSLTLGKRGIYGNAGIPGTGLSYRTRIDKRNHSTRSERKMKHPNATSPTTNEENIQLQWNDSIGDFSFSTADGRSLTNVEEKNVRSVYKNDLMRMYQEKADEINKRTDRLLHLHHQLFHPTTDIIALSMSNIQDNISHPPNQKVIYHEVMTNMKQNLTFLEKILLIFPKRKKEHEAIVMAEVEKLFQEEMSEYEENKKAYNEEKEYRNKLATKVKNGDVHAMEDWISLFLDELDFPLETDVDFQLINKDTVFLDINLPTMEEIPVKKASILKTGRLKVQEKTQREHREHYAILIGATALYLASFFFGYLPSLKTVYVSGYNQAIDESTGLDHDRYIYSIKVDRKTFYSLNMSKVHPIKAFDNFEPRLKVTKTFIFKEIEPYKIDEHHN